MKYIVGIDLGGMSAKAGLFEESGKLVNTKSVSTFSKDGFDGITKKLAKLSMDVTTEYGASYDDIVAIGVASPGVVNSNTGIVLKWSNYDWYKVPLRDEMVKLTNKKIFVLNDANAAALGEARYGATAQYQSSILITLGTGVGGGIIVDGKLLEGYMSAGGEIGHISIFGDGLPCKCGSRGCFECYASATALIRQTKRKMEQSCNSIMWKLVDGKEENVNGKTAFDAAKMGDIDAIEVIDQYVEYLAMGIANLVNVIRPEAFVLGGGIANQGEALFAPLRKSVESKSYISFDLVPFKIVGAKLGNKAGMYGSYSFVEEHLKK